MCNATFLLWNSKLNIAERQGEKEAEEVIKRERKRGAAVLCAFAAQTEQSHTNRYFEYISSES